MNTRTVARWVEIVSWAFAALGLLLPFAFHWTVFSPYREALAEWAYGSPVPAAGDHHLLGLMLGILGGSIAGKWIVHALIARGPLAEGRAFARRLTLAGLALWFALDSATSLALGAAFNVAMINVVPLALVGLPLLLARDRFVRPEAPSPAVQPRATRLCWWASIFGATTGVAIALGGTSPLFAMWFEGLEAAHYGGEPLPEPSRRLALFFFGPIGACTLAQFLMLAGLLRAEGGTRRVAAAGAVSIAAWFAVDSGYGLVHRGLFNIALVNVPALLVTLPPWLVLVAQLRRRRD